MQDPKINRHTNESQDAPPTRTFVDEEGQHWRVFERPFDSFDRRSGVSLIFTSDGAMRRVRNYPANWMELSDEELFALSWNP
jgi:hypothetical protein